MSETSLVAICIYSIPMLLFALVYLRRRRNLETVSASHLRESIDSGLAEPASLHPAINPALCIGCGSCVSACPEGKVIGLINEKAVLVNPADCIGHGACRRACPENAITLVFGTETRGVEIPILTPDFQTTVPGIYVAGELGGMGLVKNAIEQGRQAVNSITAAVKDTRNDKCEWDSIIVGCGPAGISAALEAKQRGLKALAIERSKVGGTVAHFPRMKMIMTAPAVLPGVGMVKFDEIQKEDLIAFWKEVVDREKPLLHESENLLDIARLEGGGFLVSTDKGSYPTRTVLLAMGRRGTPRTLDVPGEDLTKVVYELEDPAQYGGKRIVVVGGGDSALEAAIACSQHSPGNVTICYRGTGFNRAKRKNREAIDKLVASGEVRVLFSTVVAGLTSQAVVVDIDGKMKKIRNDHVIVCAGGVIPIGFMKNLGIEVATKYGEA